MIIRFQNKLVFGYPLLSTTTTSKTTGSSIDKKMVNSIAFTSFLLCVDKDSNNNDSVWPPGHSSGSINGARSSGADNGVIWLVRNRSKSLGRATDITDRLPRTIAAMAAAGACSASVLGTSGSGRGKTAAATILPNGHFSCY